MNTEEIKKIVAMVKGAYPRLELDNEKVEVWFMFLKDKSFKQCFRNLKYHIENKPFPPSIADVVNNSEVRKQEKERQAKLNQLLEIERNRWVDKYGDTKGFHEYWEQFKSEYRG